jgi:hypothetical protein
LAYAASLCIFVHGVLTDPKLKGNRVDLLDGEKLLVEACMGVVVVVTIWAWRYRLRKRSMQQSKANDPRESANMNEKSVVRPI